jgi:thiol-disulfide isomerase/thioredoxin
VWQKIHIGILSLCYVSALLLNLAHMKFICQLLGFLLLSMVVHAQETIYSQTFEGGSFPDTWSQTIASGSNSDGWQYGAAAQLRSQYFDIPASSRFVATNDDRCGETCDKSADRLISPSIDLSGVSRPFVRFDAFFLGLGPAGQEEQAFLEYSLDDGQTWLRIGALTDASLENFAWAKQYFDVSAAAGLPAVRFSILYNDNGNWLYGVAIDNFVVYQPLQYDLRFIAVDNPAYERKGLFPLVGRVRNEGYETLTKIQLNYQLNSGAVKTATMDVNILPNTNYQFSQQVVEPVDTGFYTLKVWYSLLNETGVDQLPTNDTARTDFNVILESAPRKVLIEEFTGAWCGYCPQGHLTLEEVLEQQPDAIGVCIHNDDRMAIPYDDVVRAAANINSWPSGVFDRAILFPADQTRPAVRNQNDWPEAASRRLAQATPFKLELVGHEYDPESRFLSGRLKITALAALKGDFRLGIYLVEDSVRGFGTGFDQTNYYSGANWAQGSPFYNQPNPIKGYWHRHVLREALNTNAWGIPGVVSNTVQPGDTFSYEFTYEVPSSYNHKRMTVVPYLAEYRGGSYRRSTILNALSQKIYKAAPVDTTVSRGNALLQSLTAYPNPATGLVYVQNPQGLSVSTVVYDPTGRVVLNLPTDNRSLIPVPLSGLPTGLYSLRLTTPDSRHTTLKVVVRN